MGAPTTFWNQDFDNNDRYHMLTLNADIAIWCDMITRYDIVDALCIHNYSVTYDAFIYDFIATCCTRSNSAPRSLLVKQLTTATCHKIRARQRRFECFFLVICGNRLPQLPRLKFRSGHMTKSRSLRQGRFGMSLYATECVRLFVAECSGQKS